MIISKGAILYIKATVSVCLSVPCRVLCKKGGRVSWKISWFENFDLCDSYYPIDRGGASTGGKDQRGGQHGRRRDERKRIERKEANTGQGRAWAKKDRAGGSSTGALCTRFTLIKVKGVVKERVWPMLFNYKTFDSVMKLFQLLWTLGLLHIAKWEFGLVWLKTKSSFISIADS